MLNKKLKVFLDTNVLLDMIFHREPFAQSAETIFWLREQKRITLLLSITSFITADYVAKKYGYSREQIRETLKQIESITTITMFNQKRARIALESSIIDFEDAVQVQNAVQAKANVIVTRNIKDFAGSTVPCYEPNEFLQNHASWLQ